MPSKNTVKLYDVDAYYHIYNRGVDKRVIFKDDEDYAVFTHLLKRYLGYDPERDRFGREYEKLTDEVKLVSFCLMPNHFHLLLYQLEPEAITKLMRAVVGSYVRYFNKRHGRVGGLFQGIYKASHVDSDGYLQHITRYIHLNPKDYMDWRWSSLSAYLQQVDIDWLDFSTVVDWGSPGDYLQFMKDYASYEHSLEVVEEQMAHT